MKNYINIVVILFMLIGLNWHHNSLVKKSEINVTNKLTEMSNNIMLKMNKNALEIQGVKRIIDSSIVLASETTYNYAEEIVKTAHRNKYVSVELLTSVLYHESRFRYDVCSNAGACGIGQLMPETVYWIANEWNIIYTDSLVFDYKFNIRATAWYLNFLYQVPINSKGSLERTVAYYNGGSRQAYRWELYKKHQNGIKLDSLEMFNMKHLSEETFKYVHNVIHSDSLFKKIIRNELPIDKEEI